MIEEYVFEVKKPHGSCRVVTAKPPDCMIDKIDKFREDWKFKVRNDAIIILLANGLHHLGLIDEDELNQYCSLYCPPSVKGDGHQ